MGFKRQAGLEQTHEVGSGKRFARIEEAVAVAKPGDRIRVYPLEGDAAYEKTAVLVRTPHLDLVGMNGANGRKPRLSGDGYDYSGAGSTPRAIVQFQPEAVGAQLENFVLTGAHNQTHNGAGVRINGANDVMVAQCEITGCDMGVMSSGNARARTGANLLIAGCRIHRNGSDKDPGQNHNLYLGGWSVSVVGCHISHSLTGHNLKSRAHFNYVEGCYIHDAANREVDLVDGAETEEENSHSVLVGCVIAKQQGEMRGNRGVVHFGQDGGKNHRGTLYCVHCTVVSPYQAPLFDLSAPGTGLYLANNLFVERPSPATGDAQVRQQNRQLIGLRNGANPDQVSGVGNNATSGLKSPPSELRVAVVVAKREEAIRFVQPQNGDFRLVALPDRLERATALWDELRFPDVKNQHLQPLRALRYYAPLIGGMAGRTPTTARVPGACPRG